MIDKELVIDNIQGAISLIEILGQEMKENENLNGSTILDSLINANVILLRQTKSYLREELK